MSITIRRIDHNNTNIIPRVPCILIYVAAICYCHCFLYRNLL